ncbi:MAG: hypothetical protein ACOVSR_08725 [Bacteroidia bacterium]
MFKFLVYLFLFYAVSRLLFGTLLNFKQGSNTQNFHDDPNKEESKVKIKPDQQASSKTKTNSSNIGEYVDFEEIK